MTSEAKSARIVHSVLANDLKLIGLFKILNPRGFLADLKREGVGIQPDRWSSVGAQGVVKIHVKRRGADVAIDFYLYEVAKGVRPVLRKTYQGSRKEVRLLTHQFGDDIVKYFTGTPGIFTTKIAFASGGHGAKRSQIYVIDYDGFGGRRVSRTGSQNVLPSWTPDGQLSWTSFLWRNPDLFLGPPTGRRPRRISKRPGLNTGGAWSPSGDRVAVTLSKDGNAEIYILNRDGRIQKRLTRYGGIDTSPTWSPDGSQIAFVSDRAGSPQIFVKFVTGGSARRLTYRGTYNQEPAWCPRRETPLIAYTARDEKGAYDIVTVDIKSGETKRLTQGQGSNMSPSWAPNGRLIVFVSSRGGLWLMNAEGFNQHQIYRGRASTPSWSSF